VVIAVGGDAARRGQGVASDEVDRLRFEALLAEGRRPHCPHTGPFVSTEQDSGPCLEAGHGTSCCWALQEVAAMATVTAPAHARSWQHSFRAVWAAALTGLFGLLFTGLTVLTATLWAPARHDEQGR
jgi:hypothetical protein